MSNPNEEKKTENSFIQDWERIKKDLENVSAISIKNSSLIADLDTAMVAQINQINKLTNTVNALSNMIRDFSVLQMAMLSLSYSNKKITKKAVLEKMIQFSVEDAKKIIEEDYKANRINQVDISAADSIIVYKTKEIPYAIINVSVDQNYLSKKVSDKIEIYELDESGKQIKVEAEIMEIYSPVKE